MTMLDANTSDLGRVARATPSTVAPELRFQGRHPAGRHAGSDPAVVLHELGHLVLCAGVGGGQVTAPFEASGESAAVNEGLADFIGLTLWNALRRSLDPGAGPSWNFGSWVFNGVSRDYAPYLNGGGAVYPQGGTPHLKGMVLCGALIRTWTAVAQSANADTADEVLLGALCRSLPLLPHQGSLPHFCCVSKALRMVIAIAHKPRLTSALLARGIPDACIHIQ